MKKQSPVESAACRALGAERNRTAVRALGSDSEGSSAESVRFYLGTHRPNWLGLTDVPLFLSRRWLAERKTLPVANGRWALDSGGFTELNLYGEWRTTPAQYAREALRFQAEIGGLDWAAPQDWMCEPHVLAKTGKTVAEHQALTIRSYLELRETLGGLVVPVLQGQVADDYLRHIDQYAAAGVDVTGLPTVGVGTVCRRSRNLEACAVLRPICEAGVSVHAFGIKGDSLLLLSDVLVSADSMAWSRSGRHSRLPGCAHRSCANCLRFALRWRDRLIASLGQLSLEVAA